MIDFRSRFESIDTHLASNMGRWGIPALRISIAIIFIWFGILKPIGISPAADLVRETVSWMPVFDPDQWLIIIGWWEVLIGLSFLHPRTIRFAILLLALQMVGTFLPLIVLPDIVFQPERIPFGPTLEGQYIIKNLVIIAAAIAVGGTVRDQSKPARSEG
ncbi:MAG: hypothetical protein HKN43_06215 [Rhodothermales bacterium]|nr:hypothetical protein [Rhodothermales bacterium]